MNQPIRILIADDQALFREGLSTLLAVQPDLEVVGEAANGEEVLRMTALHHPHVVLMDLRMPVLDGVTATGLLTSQYPDVRVIVLTTFDDDESVFDGLRAGAVGYLLKDVSSEKLFEAIRAAARGEYFLQPSITARVVTEFARFHRPSIKQGDMPIEALSKREVEILLHVAPGASNKEIGRELSISRQTVKNHMSSILRKLAVNDRTQAAVLALRRGWIRLEDTKPLE
jgi:DNA-binding NarL/FixJ family response regulator